MLLYTSTLMLNAASTFYNTRNLLPDAQRSCASTKVGLATSSAVTSGSTAVVVLGATVAEGGALAGLLVSATASPVSGDGQGGSGGGGSRHRSGGHGAVATAVAETGLAASSAVVGGATAVVVLRAAVSKGGSKAGSAVLLDKLMLNEATYDLRSSGRTAHGISGNLLS